MAESLRNKALAEYASGLAFLESRGRRAGFTEPRASNCGTGTGGFQKGNSCASGAVASVAKSAAKGAATGVAVTAGSGFFEVPPALLAGAAAGAAVGFVKGIYDRKNRPTKIGKKIGELGTTESKINTLVKNLGGSNNSVLDLDGKKGLTLSVKDDKKKTQYTVDISKQSISVYPRCKLDCFDQEKVDRLAKFAKDATSKNVRVVIKPKPGDYTKRVLGRLTKAGFKATASTAGKFVVATFAVPEAVNATDKAVEALSGSSSKPKRK
jgi:hypothetical protein